MKLLLTSLLLTFTLAVSSQEFDIRSFAPDRADLRARVDGRTSVNGDACALIDVVSNIKGMQFESNIGIVEVKHRDDGYDVYVAPLERSIKLLATGYLSKEINLPEPAQAHTVYKLVVATKGASVAQSDLVRITFRINESEVYIRSGDKAPVMATGRNAMYNLPKGKQRFTFSKAGFEDKTLDLDISKDEVMDVQLQPGSTETAMELKGFIIVTSEPSGAEVFLNGQQVGITPYQGRQLPGAYTLALRMHLYHEHSEQFSLSPGGTTELPAIALKAQFGTLHVMTEPAGADVLLDGKSIGTTPISAYQLGSGSHNLELRAAIHHPLQQRLDIKDGEEKRLSLALKPAYGSLHIDSDPPGATVYLDNQEAGSTPYREERQASGSYQLRLESELHSSTRATLTVEDEKRSEHFFALTKNYGTLRIESEGADIYLDDKKMGTGSLDHRAAPGSYALSAKKDRHDDDSREVFLTIGQVETIKLAPKPRTGAISIMTEPFEASGAEIWIDGKKTEYRTPAVLELLEGEYKLVLRMTGYNDYEFSATVKKGIHENKEIVMDNEPPPGKLEVTAADNAYGSKVYINDEDLGLIAPGTIELEAGSYTLAIKESGYKDITKKIIINAGQTTSFSLSLSEIPTTSQGVYPVGTVHCILGGTKVVEVTNPKTGRTWMDRNLGAKRAATSPTDEKSYGDLYQWGRFSDGHQCRDSETTDRLSPSDRLGHGMFILTDMLDDSTEIFDWRSTHNNKLWRGINGINNPCPIGFRLPTVSEWEQELKSWLREDTEGAFGSPLKLSATGYRHLFGGSLMTVGNIGHYWSTMVSDVPYRGLSFGSRGAGISVFSPTFGRSVRCIKD